MEISHIRYAGVYSGPSYGNPWAPSFEGFTSLKQARERYAERQATSGVYPLDSTELTITDGEITEFSEMASCWPATSPEDTLEIYTVTDARIAGEPVLRFTAGPRGGVVSENY